MIVSVLLVLGLLSLLVFTIPLKYKYFFSLALLLSLVGITTYLSVGVIISMQPLILNFQFSPAIALPTITLDPLSAFFMLVVNFTITTGFLYAHSYLKPYLVKKSPLRFSIHYFAYLWLYLAMFLVCTIRDGFPFLIVWELMSVSSFLLVIFDAEERDTMKAGINYLIQMHVGFLFLLTAFILLENETGSASLNNLMLYFSSHDNVLLFALFFMGFGIKAGFVPLHSWLPLAHPAAPSHVSGVMSGVMIKMGIFGILRVLFVLQTDLLVIGAFLLVISVITGVIGVMFATVQRDLKKLLAYSSIENIGIIGIGMGLGLIGKAIQIPALQILGFGGALLHLLNHSLFKSLLFFNAGSVYLATHTRNIEQLGGLIKKMPYTAFLFLIGALAICGLPPFNGFVSEYLIYSGLYSSLYKVGFYESALMLGAIIGLALIGGMAVFAFTRAFGIVFLGSGRSEVVAKATEIDKGALFTLAAIMTVMVAVGLLPMLFMEPIFAVVSHTAGLTSSANLQVVNTSVLMNISIVGGVFVLLTTVLLVWRRFHLKRINQVSYGPTWGCGYTAGTAKHQYTGASFADNFAILARPVLQSEKEMLPIEEHQIFPSKRHFKTHQHDMIKRYGIELPIQKLLELFKKISIMQTGQIQHYILYAFVFMLVIFALTFFNIL